MGVAFHNSRLLVVVENVFKPFMVFGDLLIAIGKSLENLFGWTLLKKLNYLNLKTCKQISITAKLRYDSIAFSFRRVPRGGNDDFSVKSVCNLVDDSLLSSNMLPTRWVKEIPIKLTFLRRKFKMESNQWHTFCFLVLWHMALYVRLEDGCLNSAYASVLVNGSPTKEFKIERGLRQGDPLSPFLFIIAIEALHVTLQEAKSKNVFEGIKVGSNKVDISHLQYADDALIMGKWSLENATNLCPILRCFHLASGLKVNFSKSRLFGIGVTTSESHHMASILCFQPSMLPCSFLGLPIGANMNKASSWKSIIEKFHKRLSS
ncbi:putative RNA-directed DNA polymerase, eukaryota, reverse transcriptase zinc-binding domain protein [Tanacetum coccineum]